MSTVSDTAYTDSLSGLFAALYAQTCEFAQSLSFAADRMDADFMQATWIYVRCESCGNYNDVVSPCVHCYEMEKVYRAS